MAELIPRTRSKHKGWSRIMRITGLLAVFVVLSSQPAVAVKRHASIRQTAQHCPAQ
jgi:hypothetical protein